MLQLKHIEKTFNPGTVNEKRALTDLNLDLKDGDFATIVGSNGAGKSTLLAALWEELRNRRVRFMSMKGRSFWMGRISPIRKNICAVMRSDICSRIRFVEPHRA